MPAITDPNLPRTGRVVKQAGSVRAARASTGEKTSNRPVGGEIVDVVDEAARGE